MKSSIYRTLAMMALVVLVSVAGTACATRVSPGYVGIKISNAGSQRGVDQMPLTVGWTFYMPGVSTVYEYPTFVQQVTWTKDTHEGNAYDESITFTNADQMTINADVSLAYHIKPEMVPAFYTKFRSDDIDGFSNGYLHSLARDAFNEVGGRYTIAQIMGDNGPFLKDVRTTLQKALDPIGVVLEPQFGFIGAPRPPQAVINAINAKVQAEQIAQQKQNEIQQAKFDADKKIAAAQGQADSILKVAQAQAQANDLLNKSLTPTLIQYEQLQKWNGVLPTVTGGAIPLLNLPNHLQPQK